LHGLVRDKDRQKMSKSKGNVIDPIAVAGNFGADALRMALIFNTSLGYDVVISEDKILAQKKFANKIWNAARFSLQNLDKNFNPKKIKPIYTKKDKWILGELKKTSEKITKNMASYKFHEAAQRGYQFFWHKFCDKCIEDVKARIREPKSKKDKETAQLILWTVLIESIKLLHPFMPFVTEAVYQEIPHKPKKALIVETWPK
jgi:valyl-tRNA synthetase